MTLVRTIHHLEDEPEAVLWIPKLLRNYYWLTHRGWVRPEQISVDDPDGGIYVATFKLYPAEPGITIRHRIYRTGDLFRSQCQPVDGDIILLDVMKQKPNGDFIAEGLPLLDQFENRKGVTVFVVTGYPLRIPDELRNRLKERLVVKPMDMVSFTRQLANRLGIEHHGDS